MFSGKNHFGNYTAIKNTIAKLICVICATLLGFALVLFVTNRLDFLPEVNLHKYVSDSNIDNTSDSDTPNNIDSENVPPTVTVTPNTEPAVTVPSFISQCEVFNSDKKIDYHISDLPYDSSNLKLMKVNSEIVLPDYYSLSKITMNIPLEDVGILATTYPRPALHPRMGFIIMQKEDMSFALLNSDGKFLCDIPDGMTMLSARDSDGNPVFGSPDGYFYFSEESNTFLPSSYDPFFDIHSATFDFPSYYEAPTEEVYRTHGTAPNSWGFAHIDGRQIVSGIYAYAYQFSQGYGVVQYKNGRVSFHNKNGYTRFTDHTFYTPEHSGINNLGFYSFDHGLMRVREVNYNWLGEKTYEREYVTHLGNNEFFIPLDYNIESYFDGVFLLSKDGKYGYFNYLGEWICQPVYTYATPFIEGMGVVGFSNGKKGVIDENGNYIVPMIFDEISRCSGGVITLYDKQEGWFILNKVKTDIIREPVTPVQPVAPDPALSVFDYVTSKASFLTTYTAEPAAYNYTIWMYNNPIAILNKLLTYIPFGISYVAEAPAYDYTMWAYNNPPIENPLLNRMSGRTPLAVTYTAEQAAYDYTIWLYNNIPSEEMLLENTASSLHLTPSYVAESAAYDYTIWTYNNSFFKVNAFENVISTTPLTAGYYAEQASYNYTMWVYNTDKVANSLIVNTVLHTPTYIAEQAAYDYTTWMYESFKNQNALSKLLAFSPFSITYTADPAAYDYTVWGHTNIR